MTSVMRSKAVGGCALLAALIPLALLGAVPAKGSQAPASRAPVFQVLHASGASPLPGVVSCPTRTTCWGATYQGIVRSRDAGAKWSWKVKSIFRPLVRKYGPLFTGNLVAISCSTTTTCVVVGTVQGSPSFGRDFETAGLVLATRDGVHWSTTIVRGIGGLEAAHCATRARCYIGGSSTPDWNSPGVIYESSLADDSWHPQRAPAPAGGVWVLQCTSTLDCVALTDKVPGGQWHEGVPYNGALTVETHDGGQRWKVTSDRPKDLPGDLWCGHNGECFLGNTPGVEQRSTNVPLLVSSDGGTTWHSQGTPSRLGEFDTIDCPSPTSCWALTGTTYIEHSVNEGRSWTIWTLPHVFGTPESMSLTCPTDRRCLVSTENWAGNGSRIAVVAVTL